MVVQRIGNPKPRSPINSLPNNKILVVIKLKAFANDNINVAQMMISVFDREENIVGKGVNAGTIIFSFSHNIFKRLLSWGLL